MWKEEKALNLKLIASFIAITVLFVIGGARILHMPQEQLKAGKWVTHTHEVLYELESLSLGLNQAEDDVRGYLFSDAEHLTGYQADTETIGDDINNLKRLTMDNAGQQNRLGILQKDIAKYLAELWTMARKETLNAEEKSNISTSQEDPKLTFRINKQIEDMKAEEKRLLQIRLQDWYSRSDESRKYFIAGAGLLYMLICVALGSLYSLATQRKKLVAAEKEKADHLEKIVTAQRKIVGHSANMQQTLNLISEKMLELTSTEGCVVEMLDGSDMVYRAASGTGAAHIGFRLKAEGSFTGLCLRENTLLRCDDSETDDRVDKEACRKVGLRSMIVVPLRHHDVSVGVLKVMSSKTAAFNEEDIFTLELMAGLLSAALSDAVAINAIRLNNIELTAANIDLEKLATTDGLTGLQNRRTFQAFFQREYDLAVRHKKPLSLIMLDVDHFKKFNDSFGHPAGDAVLQRVGALLQKAGRSTDCIARYGGEEFVLLLPETGPDEAMIIASRILKSVAENKWEHRQVTVSVGVSSLREGVESAADLLDRADKALYGAKNGGRNQVAQFSL